MENRIFPFAIADIFLWPSFSWLLSSKEKKAHFSFYLSETGKCGKIWVLHTHRHTAPFDLKQWKVTDLRPLSRRLFPRENLRILCTKCITLPSLDSAAQKLHETKDIIKSRGKLIWGANRLVWAHISIVLEKDISLMWQKSPMLYPWNNEMYFRCRTLRWKSWRNIPITSSRWRPRITLDWGLLRSSNYARKMEVSEMYWRHGYILPDVYRDFTLGIVKAYLLNAWCIMERLPFWIHTVCIWLWPSQLLMQYCVLFAVIQVQSIIM